MELTGKVIIFDKESDAKEWFKTIEDIIYNNKLETIEAKMKVIIKKASEEIK